MTTRADPPVVVIGAGPYGLSAAAHLRACGLRVRTLGEVMHGWRAHMPAGMFLKSTPAASSLSAPAPGFTLADFCRASGTEPLREDQVVPIDLFIRYGTWFQQRLVPDVESAHVCQLERSGRRFHVKLASREEIETATVVMASGMTGFSYLPPELAAAAPEGPMPTGTLSHSSQHNQLSAFAGRDVAVIGAGQSALESAALLQEAGTNVQLIVRGRVRFGDPPEPASRGPARLLPAPRSPLGPAWSLYPFSHAPGMFRHLPQQTRLALVKSVLGPLGGWWLRERVVGQFPIHAGHRVIGACRKGQKVVLAVASAGGEQSLIEVDHVLAATGYRVDLDKIGILSPELSAGLCRGAGSPRLSASFESSVPGLFFVGLSAAATFGPVMRFVCGARFAARRVAMAVASQAGWG